MILTIPASIAIRRPVAPPIRRASTSVPTLHQALSVSVWLPVLFSMAGLCGPVTAEAATVWNGPKIIFTKASGADPKLAANQDRLTSNVWLTRGSSQGIYNIARETLFSHSVSPTDTEWASGTTANYASLVYTDWETWARSVGNPPATPGVNAVLHLKTDDTYIDVKFLSWSERTGGGFSYERSTPAAGVGNADCLFNWAERTYPTLFAPAAASATFAPYYYRYYSLTNAYLGTSSVDNHVYYVGSISSNALLDVGALSTWLVSAGCQ